MSLRVARVALGLALCAVANVSQSQNGVSDSNSTVELASGPMRIRISALTDDILRIRIAPRGLFAEDASWVVASAMRARTVPVHILRGPAVTEFQTATLAVRIDSSTLRVTIADLKGNPLTVDAPERAVETAGDGFTLRKALSPTEHFFGLGDKAGPLDRRGHMLVNWNSDAYGFQESSDPLYKSVPFFIATGGAGGSYGIFLDNTWRSWFDFGKQDPRTLGFGSDGGPIDYYVIRGPAVRDVVKRYTELTGRAPLPPLWSLGFQQSRYSYMSAADVRHVASTMRGLRIPADVLWLDIDYQDRYRPFTTNRRTFPDLRALTTDLHRDGFQLVAITDLHVAYAPGQNYAPYDSGVAGDHFIKGADGAPYIADVWPGAAVFPEFTRGATRDWWGGLYREFTSDGIAGFWNDMNEPAIFHTATRTMPLDNRHEILEPGFASRTATHAEIHNVYGMLNSRATFEGLRKLRPDERPFVMTRASFAGGQQYAATWTGDNSSTWNHLKLSISMLLNLGMSGFAYAGADVGGFAGTPSADLLTRWIEIAAFTPVFRIHSATGTAPREPWVDGPRHTDIRRRFIEQRYRLLPYLYALADENAHTGAPLMRPVFYEFPEDLESPCERSNAFLLGARLLIAPPADFEAPNEYDVCLPAGAWFDYWSGLPVQPVPARAGESVQRIRVTPALDRLPVFVRAGAILPLQEIVQSTARSPTGPLTLDVYPGPDCSGVVYLDDGHSTAYDRGDYLRQEVTCNVTDHGMTVNFGSREGRFEPWWRRIMVQVHGWRGAARVSLDGVPMVGSTADRAATLHVSMGDIHGPAVLSLEHAKDH